MGRRRGARRRGSRHQRRPGWGRAQPGGCRLPPVVFQNGPVSSSKASDGIAHPSGHEPDVRGHFGKYGGRFVPEALIAALDELTTVYEKARGDRDFLDELDRLHRDYTGRPSPLTDAPKLGEHAGGARILLKREDLNHTGSHKINNVLGQALLTKRMGKTRVIAETGAGQHGVATATACALLDLPCVVYMGVEDIRRQEPNVLRMRALGAELRPVVGDEAAAQLRAVEGRLPDAVVACVGGGSNAIGLFSRFIGEPDVRLVGVEAAGEGIATGHHAAALAGGTPGVLHGARSYLLQDDDGQVEEAHSISAGLDYPGIGPQLSALYEADRL